MTTFNSSIAPPAFFTAVKRIRKGYYDPSGASKMPSEEQNNKVNESIEVVRQVGLLTLGASAVGLATFLLLKRKVFPRLGDGGITIGCVGAVLGYDNIKAASNLNKFVAEPPRFYSTKKIAPELVSDRIEERIILQAIEGTWFFSPVIGFQLENKRTKS